MRELESGNTFVQVWAYLEGNTWQGVNILPLSPEEAEELQQQWQDAPPLPISVSLEAIADSAQAKKVKSSWPQTAMHSGLFVRVNASSKAASTFGASCRLRFETNPELQHISIEATGCMKACKQGPNLKSAAQRQTANRYDPGTSP